MGLKRVTNGCVTNHTETGALGAHLHPLQSSPLHLQNFLVILAQPKLKANDILQLTREQFSYQCINLNID